MIVSYRDKRTRDFAAGKRVKAFSGIERPAHLKLDRLGAAVMLGDLAWISTDTFWANKMAPGPGVLPSGWRSFGVLRWVRRSHPQAPPCEARSPHQPPRT